jgi:5-methylcytosine-specific restriction protein B
VISISSTFIGDCESSSLEHKRNNLGAAGREISGWATEPKGTARRARPRARPTTDGCDDHTEETVSQDFERSDVPGFTEYMNPTLAVLREQAEPMSIDALEEAVAKRMELSTAILAIPHSETDKQPEAYYRIAWVRTYLKKVGLIDNPTRAMWRLTDKGRATDSVDPTEIIRQVNAGVDAEALSNEVSDVFADEIVELCPRALAELGHPEGEALIACYALFRSKFGPAALAELEGEALLAAMHGRGSKDSLAYWLEFKNDDQLPAVFGSISGGSALKFGIYQNKDTGHWMIGSPNKQQRLSTPQAVAFVSSQRAQLIAGADVLAGYAKSPEAADYKALQVELEYAAPDLAETAWGHKYFSLLYPELVDAYHALEYQRFHLLRLHKLPADKRYQNAWFFAGIARQLGMPISHLCAVLKKRHGPPYRWWRLRLDRDELERRWPEMRAGGYVLAPWGKTGSLAEVQPGTVGRQHVKALLDEHYPGDPGASTQLYRFAVDAAPRDRIAIMGETEIVAVGSVSGDYVFVEDDELGHRVPIQWLSTETWRLPKAEALKKTFVDLKQLPNRLAIERHVATPEGDTGTAPPQPGPKAPPPLEGVAARIESVLKRKKQVILYGPPGTGKTYWAERTLRELAARSWFSKRHDDLDEAERAAIDDEAIERCCFHPAYGYEDFVIGYRPVLDSGALVFKAEKGVFVRLCERARVEPRRSYFILIDEINRGDLPRIFGELLMVLEADKRGMPVTLPISGERLVVPKNVHMVGTMNTADRSVALLDAALRRRFGFVELLPDSSVLGSASVQGIPLGPWLDDLNAKVLKFAGRDSRSLQVGHSYLLSGESPVQDAGRFVQVLRDDIIPLLQEYCYEDFGSLAEILGSEIVQADQQRIDESLFEPERRDDLIAALLAAAEGITATTTATDADATTEHIEDIEDDEDDEDEDDEDVEEDSGA